MHRLDPRIHEGLQRCKAICIVMMERIMDCRAKPGNDNWATESTAMMR